MKLFLAQSSVFIIASMAVFSSSARAATACVNDSAYANGNVNQKVYNLALQSGLTPAYANALTKTIDPNCKSFDQTKLENLAKQLQKTPKFDPFLEALVELHSAAACGYINSQKAPTLLNLARLEAKRFGKSPILSYWIAQTACATSTLQAYAPSQLPETVQAPSWTGTQLAGSPVLNEVAPTQNTIFESQTPAQPGAAAE
jgi:hypothetical protein